MANPFAYWFFGAQTKEEKDLLKQVLKDTDSKFLKWALKAITSWETTERPNNLFHIHGTGDKALPIRFITPDYILKKGEHVRVYSKAASLSGILTEILDRH